MSGELQCVGAVEADGMVLVDNDRFGRVVHADLLRGAGRCAQPPSLPPGRCSHQPGLATLKAARREEMG